MAPIPPSKLDIEAWNSELTEGYVGAISREVHRAVKKIALRGCVQSVVAGG